MKVFDEWLSEQTCEDIDWYLKVYGTITKAYDVYVANYEDNIIKYKNKK